MKHVRFNSLGLLVLAGALLATGCENKILYIHAVRVADGDGSNRPNITTAQFQTMLDNANRIWIDDAGIEFRLAGESDLNSTRVNQLSPSDDGCWLTRKISNEGHLAAQAEALKPQYAGKIVVFFRYWSLYPMDSTKPDAATCTTISDGNGGQCKRCAPKVNFSGVGQDYVAMARQAGATSFSHEVGHYLGLNHTFEAKPQTGQELIDLLLSGVNWVDVLDGDEPTVTDTPMDPGVDAYRDVNAVTDKCAGPGTVGVMVPTPGLGNVWMEFTPDRENIMSYFQCWTLPTGRPTLTSSQMRRVYSILATRRASLLDYAPATALTSATFLGRLGLPASLRQRIRSNPYDPRTLAAVCSELKTKSSRYLSRTRTKDVVAVRQAIRQCSTYARTVVQTRAAAGPTQTRFSCPADTM